MGKIYTGIELGASTIKVLTLEVVKGNYHVLSVATTPSRGIKKQEIVDIKSCISSLQIAVKKVEEQLNMKITKSVLVLPSENAFFSIEHGTHKIEDRVTGYEIKAALKDAVFKKNDESSEIVGIFPISFSVDDGANVLDPKGSSGSVLSAKVVMSTMPKEKIFPYFQVLKALGIEVADVILAPQADYLACETKDYNRKMGAIINIGEETTTVSIFNKGILIKNETIAVGSLFVDKDLAYIYQTDLKTARLIKETFAITSSRYADTNEWMSIKTLKKEEKKINQIGASKVIESRLEEILKLSKTAINNLTKREISYIIVVGGISELAGFAYLLEDLFGHKANVWNIKEIGIRHNQFTSVLGSVKYYHQRCMLLDTDGTMFSLDAQSNLVSMKKKGSLGSDISLNKFFGHFLDN